MMQRLFIENCGCQTVISDSLGIHEVFQAVLQKSKACQCYFKAVHEIQIVI